MTLIEIEKAIQSELELIPKEQLGEVLTFLQKLRKEQPQETIDDPFWGMFADDADLIDEIVQETMEDRANQKFRTSSE